MPGTSVKYLDFSGGMQNATSRFLQRDNELSLSLNADLDTIGSIKKRLGYKRAGANDIEATETITKLYDGGTYLYAHADTTIYYNNSATNPVAGTWTAVTGGTNPGASMLVQMARFKDIGELYIAGANPSPTSADHFLVTQRVADEAGAPGTKADADTAQFPRAKFVVRWLDRLYFGYCFATWYNEGSLAKPERVVYTNVPTAGALTGQTINDVDFTNFLDADDPITAMWPMPDSLTVFTEYALWQWTTNSWKKKWPIGCVGQNTIANVDIYTIFYNKDGIFVYTGGKPQLISNKIQPIIDAISNPSACFAWNDDKHYYLWVGSLTLDGISYQNCVIEYSVYTNGFNILRYTLPIRTGTTQYTITAGTRFDNGSTLRTYLGNEDGVAYYMSHPGDSTKVYTDGDQTGETYDIELKAQTKRWDLGLPEDKKRNTIFTLFSENPSHLVARIRGDGGDWHDIASIEETVQRNETSAPEAYDYQFEFSEIGNTEGPSINGIQFDITQTEERGV